MKPKPFVALNHLTVPVAILLLQDAQMRAVPARPSRELDPISAMSWGGEPVRRDQQGKSTIRMGGVYTTAREIASGKEIRAINGRSAFAQIRRRRCRLARPRSRLFDAKTLRKFYSRCAV